MFSLSLVIGTHIVALILVYHEWITFVIVDVRSVVLSSVFFILWLNVQALVFFLGSLAYRNLDVVDQLGYPGC